MLDRFILVDLSKNRSEMHLRHDEGSPSTESKFLLAYFGLI